MLSSGQLIICVKISQNCISPEPTVLPFASYIKDKATNVSKATCISISSQWKFGN